MRNKMFKTPLVAACALLLTVAFLAATALGDGYGNRERFFDNIGGMITRLLPTSATTNTHKEIHLTGDQRVLTFGGNPGKGWAITHTPAAATQATISKAAETGQVHVIRGWSATLVSGASAPTAATFTIAVRDGATGAGTIKAGAGMSIPATAGITSPPWVVCDTYVTCTANTAATIEFSGAGGANTVQSVSMWGETMPYVAD